MSRDKLIEAIEHYQRNLDRGLKDENTTKLLHCIFKLSNMPITVAHLEETGIGRTVNSMRKIDGEVGDAARELVNKWKLMVSQNQDCDETNKNESNSKSDSSHRPSDKGKSKERYKQESRRRSEEDDEKSEKSESDSDNSSSDEKLSEENSESSDNGEDEEEEEDEREIVKRQKSESPPRKYEKSSKYKQNHESSKHDKYKESYDRDKESSSRHRESNKYKSNNDKYKENTDKHRDSRDRHKESNGRYKEDHRERRKETYSSRSPEKEKYKSRSPEKEKYKTSSEKDKHRSSSPEKDRNREKYNESKHKESSKRKRESESEENDLKKVKSYYKNQDKYKKEKDKYSESKHKEKDRKESRRDDTKHESKEKHKKSAEEKPKKVNQNENGICSESGTSFADALGMLEPSTSKGPKKFKPEKGREKEREKTPEKQREILPKSESREKEKKYKEKSSSSSSSSKSETSKEHDKKATKMEIVIPPPPPKVDLDINISSLLPTITPNYRPLANPLYDSPLSLRGKTLNDDEALSMVMSQKNQRTKVYSGNKMFWGSVPTLFELCIRVLQDNIDALEYTGGVPFAILKPVLDKASPQQLYMLEHYNPYLIEDTDDIWQFHCSKEFKNKRREELESWRDMYMRCLDEREAKLKALTENIKVSQEKSTPVRQTKLAYIDSVVKPPRDVIRKQAKNGIDKKPLITPQSRLNAIAAGSSTAQVSVPNPVRASSNNSSSAVKPKKAPLMQKTLAFLKGGRFRR